MTKHDFGKELEIITTVDRGQKLNPKKVEPTPSKQEMIEEVSARMVEGWQHINPDIVELACRKYLAPKFNVIINVS